MMFHTRAPFHKTHTALCACRYHGDVMPRVLVAVEAAYSQRHKCYMKRAPEFGLLVYFSMLIWQYPHLQYILNNSMYLQCWVNGKLIWRHQTRHQAIQRYWLGLIFTNILLNSYSSINEEPDIPDNYILQDFLSGLRRCSWWSYYINGILIASMIKTPQ